MNVDDPNEFEQHPLWRFSVEHYPRPNVAAASLRLQDGHGLDVNVMLACLWWERGGGAPLEEPQVEAMLEGSAELRARVHEIRTQRREAKEAGMDARASELAGAELKAENRVQRVLCDVLGEPSGGSKNSGRTSLQRYAQQHGHDVPAGLLDAMLVDDEG